MKRPLLLLLLALIMAFCGVAQTRTVVYGNLGVENVNISVYQTQYGTVTDTKGNYEIPLFDRNKYISLYYSCIGYQDTIISLSPRQLQHDSINISFTMRPQKYSLQEVNIVADRLRFNGDKNIIIDFEIYDGIICILQGSGNKYRLLLADTEINVFDTLPIRKDIRPSELLKDCMGNCQLVAADSVYQINLKDKTAPYLGTERNRYFAVMDDCLFLTDQHLYIQTNAMDGLISSFYRIDLETKQMESLFISDGSDKLEDIADEMRFAAKHQSENGRGPTLSLWNKFVRKNWFCDSSAHLALAGNKLVYFDHEGCMIHQYDLNLNEISSCTIDYPNKGDWKPFILQDFKINKFYTVVSKWLCEIDLTSGQTLRKTHFDIDLVNKVLIYGGHMFILKRGLMSTGKVQSYIERMEIEQ